MFQANLMNGPAHPRHRRRHRARPGDGRAASSRLGADVAICGRRKAVCDETAAAWRQQFPERRVDTFGVDIRVAQAVDEMVESAVGQSGGLTGLDQQRGRQLHRADREPVAARASTRSPTSSSTAASTSRRRSASAGSREAKAGSVAARPAVPQRDEHHRHLGRQRQPYVVPSAMSKAGIEVMTKSLAVEWARVRHPPERGRARRDSDRGHEQAPQPGRGTRRAQQASATRWRARHDERAAEPRRPS